MIEKRTTYRIFGVDVEEREVRKLYEELKNLFEPEEKEDYQAKEWRTDQNSKVLDQRFNEEFEKQIKDSLKTPVKKESDLEKMIRADFQKNYDATNRKIRKYFNDAFDIGKGWYMGDSNKI